MQPSDTPTTEKTSRTCMQNKGGKLFFTSPRVKPQPAEKDLPAFPYRNGKMILKVSSKSKARRSKQAAEPSWLDDDDVFGFHAED